MTLVAGIDSSELKDFGDTLKTYVSLRRKGLDQVLAEKAQTLLIGGKGVKGLYQLTAEQAPSKAELLDDFRRRGWKIRIGGSARHRESVRTLANSRLGSTGSTFGTVNEVSGGLVLNEARFGARMKRIQGGNSRRTKGGGRLLGRGGVAGRADKRIKAAHAYSWDKTFTRRNVEVITELTLRQRAIKHTALGWMSLGTRRWRKGSPFPSGEHTVNRMEGITGSAVFAATGDNISVTITNSNKAMSRLDKQHGIVRRGISNVRADMIEYITQQQTKRALEVLTKASKGALS